MKSTGPILAVGGITLVNQTIVNGKPIDWKVPIATGIACGAFAMLENFSPETATGLAWLALLSVVFVRIKPDVPAPAESFVKWWNS